MAFTSKKGRATADVADLIEGEHDIDISEENLAETVAYQHTTSR